MNSVIQQPIRWVFNKTEQIYEVGSPEPQPPIATARFSTTDLLPIPDLPELTIKLSEIILFGLTNPVDDFLQKVYSFDSKNDQDMDDCTDFIFEEFNSKLATDIESDYQYCNAILASADTNKLDARIVFSFLTITRSAAKRLNYRPIFLKKSYDIIAKTLGEREAKKMLKNME